jgi:hypothetical protein
MARVEDVRASSNIPCIFQLISHQDSTQTNKPTNKQKKKKEKIVLLITDAQF